MKIKFYSLAGSLLVGLFSFWELTFGVASTNHIYGMNFFKEPSLIWWLVPAAAAGILLFFLKKRLTLHEYALRPLWLSGGIFLIHSFGTGIFCYALLIYVWSAFRYGALMHRHLKKIPVISSKWAWAATAFFTLAFAFWSWYTQHTAFKALYLIFGDWGQYAECYLRLASGGASLKEWLCSAGHFNPLINCVMAGVTALFPSAQTVFTVNALVIASAIPLSFVLARVSGATHGTALLWAALASIYPVFTRQILCLFYGFHPIVFFIPLLLCFFIFRSRNSLWGMGICMGLSLLVQETVAVFWGGWGLYLLIARRKYLAGSLLIAGLIGWFAFLTLFLQPWTAGAAVYAQNFRYAALGNTPVEVALSPFLKPAVFWGTLTSFKNLTFAAIILLPCLFAAVSFPALLLVSLPLLGGFFVQSSEAVKTPLLQYGIELGTLCWAAAIVNLNRVGKGEKTFLKCRGKIWNGIVVSAAAGVVIGYIFFGFGYKFGLYPKDYCFFKEDSSRSLDFLKKHLPADVSRVLIAQRVRAHFMFDFPTAELTQEYVTGDWILLDLHDPLFDTPEKLEALRCKLYRDPRCRPVTYANWYGKHLVLIRVAPPETPPCFMIPRVSERDFNRAAGIVLQLDNPYIQCKYDGKMFHFRLQKQPPCDYDLKMSTTFAGGTTENMTYSWYFGLYPAWSQSEGTLWSIPAKPGLVNCTMELIKRPASDVSARQAKPASATLPAKAH